MEVTIWGTRGSVPVASQNTTRFGGNTTCIEIRTDADECIILDAGTGIRALGQRLLTQPAKHCTLCFTHAHWDHLQGLPFFPPIYNANWSITMRGPATMGSEGVKASLEQVFNGRNFPLELGKTACSLDIIDFTPGDFFYVGTALVETCYTNHPGGCVAYRITADGWTFVFTGDHECCDANDTKIMPEECAAMEAFIAGADVVLADAQYVQKEYPQFKGWGHSCVEQWPDIAVRAGVKRLIFTHHDPTRTDEDLQSISDAVHQSFNHLPLALDFAFEGMRITGLESGIPAQRMPMEPISCWLCDFDRDLSRFSDVGMMLDSILTEARRVSGADAGTVYLTEGEELVFSYTQNDTLFPGSAALRHTYQNARLPISTASMAGYAAVTRRPLKIDNVRAIPEDAPFKFNDFLDRTTGYRTVSMLAIPLVMKDRMMGVLQLINKLGHEGQPVPFSMDAEARVECLASVAVKALERGLMAKELILRMLAMTALRDPAETGGHVRRVGSMAAEIYHRWAEKHGVESQELRRVKDNIRLAAMLHDVGKVGIPDSILKKPGRLTVEEREVMEQHCFFGKKLFANVDWEVDAMARDIALHHHQRWDGKGYTGDPLEPLRTGEDIPLAARITSVADVYDALISRRCYKEPFDPGFAVAILKEGSGVQFDPEVITAFLEIQDVVTAIHARYPDAQVYNVEMPEVK